MAIQRMVHGETVYGTDTEGKTTCQYVKFDPPKLETTYEGRVLDVFQRDYRAMSDVYTLATWANVLHVENDEYSIKEILVNANFECDQSGGRADVDATVGVLEIVRSLRIIAEGQRIQREQAECARRNEVERNRPVKGKKMIVTRGRKVPVGTIGIVAYVKDNNVLLKDENTWQDRKSQGVWVNADYLKVVESL